MTKLLNIENLVGDKEILPDNYGFDPKNLVKILENIEKDTDGLIINKIKV